MIKLYRQKNAPIQAAQFNKWEDCPEAEQHTDFRGNVTYWIPGDGVNTSDQQIKFGDYIAFDDSNDDRILTVWEKDEFEAKHEECFAVPPSYVLPLHLSTT
jgi:hypothetical protein